MARGRYAERWNGRRIKVDEAEAISSIQDFKFLNEFRDDLSKELFAWDRERVYLDFDRVYEKEPGKEAYELGRYIKEHAPFLKLENVYPKLRTQRTIKKSCEIEAMKKAETITKAGIEAMMKASKPGMYEYQYKAEFDYALAQHGVLSPGFPSIISAGDNNFCIHYYGYKGQAKDGDMILNDVGAVWDYEINDVSRAWPCNGKFSERQKLLYQCAYNTSEYMFKTLKPVCQPGSGQYDSKPEQLKRRAYVKNSMKSEPICGMAERIMWDLMYTMPWMEEDLQYRASYSASISEFTTKSGESDSVWRTTA